MTANPAAAAPAKVRFRIPPKAYSEALIDLALQADVSLLGASECAGQSPGLIGEYTVDEALAHLLAKAPCAWRVLGAGAVQILPLRAPAAAEPPPKPSTVAEVLVTATKRVQSTDRLAAAVSVITHEQLRATGAADVGDTSGQLAGVITTDLGPARDKLLLRSLSDGAFTGRSRSTVGTYLDDTPLNYNAPDPDLRLVDVERVEVVRGPQGALYGGGSLSGVYRIVTRKPDPAAYSAAMEVTGAGTQGGAPSGSLDTFVNIPLFAGAAAVRVSAYGEVQGGYMDDIELQKKNVDLTQREGGRISFLVRPDDTWTVDLSTTVQHLRSDDTHYTIEGLGRLRAHRIPEPHDNDIGLATLGVRGSWGWGELSSTTSFVQHRYGSVYDASRVIDQFSSHGGGVGEYRERTLAQMLVQELVLTSRGAGRFGWLAGVYASTTAEHSPASLLAGTGSDVILVYRDARQDRIRELSAYGEASYLLSPGWTVAVGARVFQTAAHTRSTVIGERIAARFLDQTVTTTGVSPKVTLQREFAAGDFAYAVFSEGHRAGGVNSGGADVPTPANQTFGQDRLLNFELGLKVHGFDRRVALRSSLFYDVWKNIQTDQFRADGIPFTANVGDASIRGLEAELIWTDPGGLSVQANTLVSRTHILRANPGFAPQLANGLPGAPNLSAGLLVSYRHPIFWNSELRLVGQANYVGRSRITFDPTLSAEMGNYVRSKLSAGVSHGRWDVELFITNPTDSVSNTFAFGNPFTFLQNVQSTPQRPTTIGISIAAAL